MFEGGNDCVLRPTSEPTLQCNVISGRVEKLTVPFQQSSPLQWPFIAVLVGGGGGGVIILGHNSHVRKLRVLLMLHWLEMKASLWKASLW